MLIGQYSVLALLKYTDFLIQFYSDSQAQDLVQFWFILVYFSNKIYSAYKQNEFSLS